MPGPLGQALLLAHAWHHFRGSAALRRAFRETRAGSHPVMKFADCDVPKAWGTGRGCSAQRDENCLMCIGEAQHHFL
jgi:hypothetical protein